MEATLHGLEHIMDRTKMLIQDVLSVVEGGAVVSLGYSGGCEFLLFYSPADRCTKIAVTDSERKVLISIWKKHFTLPLGVTRVTSKHEREARKLLSNFIFKSIKAQEEQEISQDLFLVVEVTFGAEVVCERYVCPVSRSKSHSKVAVLELVAPTFKSILRVVEENASDKKGTLRYLVWVYDRESSERIRSFRFDYSFLNARLSSTAL